MNQIPIHPRSTDRNDPASELSVWERLDLWSERFGLSDYQTASTFLEDWLGHRCDGVANPSGARPAATILWQATREYCDSRNDKQREKLAGYLTLESLIETNLLAMLNRIRPGARIDRYTSLYWAHVTIVSIVLKCIDLQVSGDTGSRELETEIDDLLSMAISLLLHERGKSCEIELVPPRDQVDHLQSSITAPIHSYMRRLANDPTRPELDPKTLTAMIQIESSVEWLVGQRSGPRPRASGHVAFVSSAANQEIGTLAVLNVASDQPSFANAIRNPIVVVDLVYQGLMRMDDAWHDHFRIAADWAASQLDPVVREHKDPHVAIYDLDFAYAAAARSAKGTNRSTWISGPSASLAAGVLAQSQWSRRPVDAGVCYVGAIGKPEGQYDFVPVRGLFAKRDAFDRHDPIGTFLIGKLSEDDQQSARRWNVLRDAEEKGKVKPVYHLEEAFEFATGQSDALRRYAVSERRLVWRKLSGFVPVRLHRVLNRSDDRKLNADDWTVLDEMTMPQRATQQREMSKEEKQTDAKSTSLDDVVNEFLAAVEHRNGTSSTHCLKILGEPGMGKTWVGLRIHLRLIAAYWRRHCNVNGETSGTLFPVWTTFLELQQRLSDPASKDLPINEIVAQLIASRLVHGASGTEQEKNRDVMRQLIDRHIENKTLVLIVDAWDERDRSGDPSSRIETSLSGWIADGQPLIATSRCIGETSLSSDPLDFLDPSNRSWKIVRLDDGMDLLSFAKKWLGNSESDLLDSISKLAGQSCINEFAGVPQLAAIICWLLENQKLPEKPFTKAAELLQFATRRILDKGLSNNSLDLSVNQLEMLLQEHLFQNFDGTRWQIRKSELARELGRECYAELIKEMQITTTQAAETIFCCGLFETAASDRTGEHAEVFHQSLAETLLAGHLAASMVVPESPSVEEAEDFVLRYGILDGRWSKVILHVAELLPNATPLLNLLLFLDDNYRSCDWTKKTSQVVKRRLETLLMRGKFTVTENERQWFDDYYIKLLSVDPPFVKSWHSLHEIQHSTVLNLIHQKAVAALPFEENESVAHWFQWVIWMEAQSQVSESDAQRFSDAYVSYMGSSNADFEPDYVSESFHLRICATEQLVRLLDIHPHLKVDTTRCVTKWSLLDNLRSTVEYGTGIGRLSEQVKFPRAGYLLCRIWLDLELETIARPFPTPDFELKRWMSDCDEEFDIEHNSDFCFDDHVKLTDALEILSSLAVSIYKQENDAGPARVCFRLLKYISIQLDFVERNTADIENYSELSIEHQASLKKYATSIMEHDQDGHDDFMSTIEKLIESIWEDLDGMFSDMPQLFPESFLDLVQDELPQCPFCGKLLRNENEPEVDSLSSRGPATFLSMNDRARLGRHVREYGTLKNRARRRFKDFMFRIKSRIEKYSRETSLADIIPGLSTRAEKSNVIRSARSEAQRKLKMPPRFENMLNATSDFDRLSAASILLCRFESHGTVLSRAHGNVAGSYPYINFRYRDSQEIDFEVPANVFVLCEGKYVVCDGTTMANPTTGSDIVHITPENTFGQAELKRMTRRLWWRNRVGRTLRWIHCRVRSELAIKMRWVDEEEDM